MTVDVLLCEITGVRSQCPVDTERTRRLGAPDETLDLTSASKNEDLASLSTTWPRWDMIAYQRPLPNKTYVKLPETMLFGTSIVNGQAIRRCYHRTRLQTVFGRPTVDEFLLPLYAALHDWANATGLVGIWRPPTVRLLDRSVAVPLRCRITGPARSLKSTKKSQAPPPPSDGKRTPPEEKRNPNSAVIRTTLQPETTIRQTNTSNHSTSINDLPEELLFSIFEYALEGRHSPRRTYTTARSDPLYVRSDRLVLKG